jgi:hypothetical protein
MQVGIATDRGYVPESVHFSNTLNGAAKALQAPVTVSVLHGFISLQREPATCESVSGTQMAGRQARPPCERNRFLPLQKQRSLTVAAPFRAHS